MSDVLRKMEEDGIRPESESGEAGAGEEEEL